jgi:hypothetical protein
MEKTIHELIRIDRETGLYWWQVWEELIAVPSVTHILETVFRPYRRDNEYALTRGTAIHKAISLLEGFGDGSGLQGGVEGLDSRLRPYIDGWLEFKRVADIKIVSCETPLLSQKRNFAGTPDLFVEVWGERAIIDVKSGGTAPMVWLQLAGYELMAEEKWTHHRDGYHRYALYLPGNGKFKLKEDGEDTDTQAFISALDCYNYMRRKLNG